jgi:hypothetical protein
MGLLVVLGLLIIGRRQLFISRMERLRNAYQQAQSVKAKLDDIQITDQKTKLSNPKVIKWS